MKLQDEFRIYDSKWHSSHSQCLSICQDTTCCRIVHSPDGYKLPPSDCVMKLQTKDGSVVFLATFDLLQKLQHTCLPPFPPCTTTPSIYTKFYHLYRSANIQLDDSAFVDQNGFRTSVGSADDGNSRDFSDFGGGWHLILPSNKDDHLKLFEVGI
jgi:hypothetical protein